MLAAWYWPDWLTFDGVTKMLRDFVVGAWEIFRDLAVYIFTAVYEFFRDMIWAVLEPAMAPFKSAYLALEGFVAQLWASVEYMHPYFDFLNAWVPVDLFIQLATAYSVLWVSLFTYRTIKSWIPTVSGGG
jgi:hypothetical protein